INLMHAMHNGKQEIGDLPTSPPATPQLGQHREDYFDLPTIYPSGSKAPEYHVIGQAQSLTYEKKFNNVISKGSVDIGILERYIPPVSSQEYQDFFTFSWR